MARMRWQPEAEGEHPHSRVEIGRHVDADSALFSDDERSIAADSWSVRSEYGSTLDGGDDLRHSDAVEALAAASLRPSDYSSDKEEPDVEPESSMLGFQSHWDSTYADELVNFHELGDAGEIWFGEDVMETMASWTTKICLSIAERSKEESGKELAVGGSDLADVATKMQLLADWNVLDLGTGNGVFLHVLCRQGFTDLTGTDYSDGAVELARAVSDREGFRSINFMVDDVLDSKLDKKFKLITDKGTFDAIGLHPDRDSHRAKYWNEVTSRLEFGGVLVITSCNNTKNELVEEVNAYSRSLRAVNTSSKEHKDKSTQTWDVISSGGGPVLQYLDHVGTYPTFRFGGVEGSRVCTVAFILKP